MRKISYFCVFAALAGLAAACGKESLQPLEYLLGVKLGYVNVDARFCTSPRSPGKQKIKYLFILDHSQSNQPGFPNPLTPTDVIATVSLPSGAILITVLLSKMATKTFPSESTANP